jgi:hypothetical protein
MPASHFTSSICVIFINSMDSSVSIVATGWTADNLRFDSRLGLQIFLFSKSSSVALGPLSLLVQWYSGGGLGVGSRPECTTAGTHLRLVPKLQHRDDTFNRRAPVVWTTQDFEITTLAMDWKTGVWFPKAEFYLRHLVWGAPSRSSSTHHSLSHHDKTGKFYPDPSTRHL